MRLSQGQLTLLETCARKFQHIYIEQMGSPISPEQQNHLTLGQQFHGLMQQWEMGLPVEPFVREDAQLQQWFTAFVESSAQILEWGDEPLVLRQSEHVRTLELGGHLLTAVYDLVILTTQHAQILDWKTYPKPQNPTYIKRNWQTRLYPFVLAETTDYVPEQMAMTYWFFQSSDQQTAPPEPQSLKFRYDRTQHQIIRQDLTRLLTQLSDWLNAYMTKGQPFPQVPEAAGYCATCSFAIRCQRGQPLGSAITTNPFSNLADILEISL